MGATSLRLAGVGNPLGNIGLRSLGRFRALRRVHSKIQRLRRCGDIRFHPANIEAKDLPICPGSSTYFETLSVERCLEELRLDGISQPFRLPVSMVDDILSYAHHAHFYAEADVEAGSIADLQDRRDCGLLTSARAICTDVTRSIEIMSILRDPIIHQIAARYLEYRPRKCEAYLEILFRMAPGVDAASYLPHQYHYDVPGFGFIAFFFYLNDVDEYNGAHVVIRRSHKNKPMILLLRSGQSAGKLVTGHYAKDLELTVRGPKGHGFIEDLYGFHKVLRPIRADRMTLQVRYY
jgi:hypothetical protein